ncbi:LysR family transcriptional regulator [Novosphingobium sp. BL-8H]|uniref:LysR family transcriptional regulator n=1 Tax=Novosphingobium sp. BL-8H TaxID=3127640 RepID=UPI0037581006
MSFAAVRVHGEIAAGFAQNDKISTLTVQFRMDAVNDILQRYWPSVASRLMIRETIDFGLEDTMQSLPSPRQLTCFITIVREGSIGGAAKALSLTQPAVSRTLADLEALLRVKLLDRSRTGINLTPAGETFLRYASSSTTALEQGLEKLAQIRSNDPRAVHFGILPTAEPDLAPRAVAEFKNLHPEVPVTVTPGTNSLLSRLLRNGELDFVIGRQPATDEMTSLQFEPIFTEEQIAVVCPGHPLIESYKGGALAEIDAFPFIFPPTGTAVRRSAERMLIAAGASRMSNFVETSSDQFAMAFANLTSAVWIAPRGSVLTHLEQGTLVALPIDGSATRGMIGITRQSDVPLSPLATELCRIIRKIAPDT